MKEQNNQFNFKTLFKGFLNALNINHGIIPTLKDLLINPAGVINNYIEGKKERYFSPGRFFVTILAILSIFTFLGSDFPVEKLREYSMLNDSKSITKGKVFDAILFFINHPSFSFILLILPLTLSSRLIFIGSKYNLAKHLVINIYCFCFIALTTAIITLFYNQEEYLTYKLEQLQSANNNTQPVLLWKFVFYEYATYLIPIVYYFYAFKNIFNLSFLSAIFKTAASFIMAFIIIFSIILGGVIIFLKDLV